MSHGPSADLAARCAAIELLAVDVDGVLTDGRIVVNDQGVESKHFHVRDGLGYALWHRAGRRSAILSGRSAEWFSTLSHDAQPEHPIGMLAAAGERPSSVNTPAASHCLGPPYRLGRAGNDHIWAILVDLLVGVPRQQGRENAVCATDHRDPAQPTRRFG